MSRGSLVWVTVILVLGAAATQSLRASRMLVESAVQLPKDFKEFRDPDKKFSMAYPKDWRIVPGLGSILVSFAQNQMEAVVAVERFILPESQDTSSKDFLNAEMDILKQKQRDAQNISSQGVDGAQKGIAINYTRAIGLNGPERLRQYSFMVGTLLFRMTCYAPSARFDKYATQCATVAGSVKALSEPSAGSFLGSH